MITARFSAVTPGTMVNGVWYKPVEQFILPKVGFDFLNIKDLFKGLFHTSDVDKSYSVCVCVCVWFFTAGL